MLQKRISCRFSRRPDPVVPIGTPLEKRPIVLSTNQRPTVAGESDHWQRTEDGVDSAALEAELA
jgi:hypothetical protein